MLFDNFSEMKLLHNFSPVKNLGGCDSKAKMSLKNQKENRLAQNIMRISIRYLLVRQLYLQI